MSSTLEQLEQLNTELEKQRQQYLAITNGLQEAIITCDVHGTIIECNKAVEKIFGWRPTDLIGNTIELLIPDELLESHRRAFAAFLMTKQGRLGNQAIDLEGLRRDGSRVAIALSVAAIDIDEQLIICAVIRDISHRKATEKHIHMLVETLKTRVASLEAFQFAVAHDLNAPLRSMEGFSEILEEDYAIRLDDNGKDCIHRIRSAVKRMRQLITDMVRLSQVTISTQIQRVEVDLSELANRIIADYRSGDPYRKIETIIQPGLKDNVDEHFMEIALTNLLNNAWKFTSKREIGRIEFGRTQDGVYYVKDNGAGFDMSKADKLFKPFSRLHDKKDYEGNGIGLTIVKQVITLHEGKVWAQGEVDKGATFFFTVRKT